MAWVMSHEYPAISSNMKGRGERNGISNQQRRHNIY
jgi:hypothetical protein